MASIRELIDEYGIGITIVASSDKIRYPRLKVLEDNGETAIVISEDGHVHEVITEVSNCKDYVLSEREIS